MLSCSTLSVCGQAYCCECTKWPLSQIHHVFDYSSVYYPLHTKVLSFFECTQCTLRIYEQRTNTNVMLNKSAIGFELSSVLAITFLLCSSFDIYSDWLFGCSCCALMLFIETISIQFKSRWPLEQLNCEHTFHQIAVYCHNAS